MDVDPKEEGARVHPLTNFVVLKEVLKFDICPQTILRNRLVSPTWLNVSAPNWLKVNKSPVLRYTADLEGQNERDGQLDRRRVIPMSLLEFYELYQAEDPVVMRMVTTRNHSRMDLYGSWQFLEGGTVPENVGISPEVDRWFWKWSATPWLTTLTLRDCEFLREAWVFKKRFLKKLPGLMNLTVRDCVVHPEALRDINEDHQNWMEDGDRRREWMEEQRRIESLQSLQPGYLVHFPQLQERLQQLLQRRSDYYESEFHLRNLLSIDVSLTVAVGGNEDGTFSMKPTTPLRIWGPLLAMVPKLKRLRIGGYQEDIEEPPPTLRPPGWDDDINEGWKTMEGDLSYGLTEGESNENLDSLRKCRKTWLGENSFVEEPGAPAPPHLGNFWELIWDGVIGQVEVNLESLDLLDFSGTAQHFGVLSTYEAAHENKDLFGRAMVYMFFRLADISLDLGLDPVFAGRDLRVVRRWAESLRRLTLYRAPFNPFAIRIPWLGKKVEELQLWGNLSPNMNFMNANFKNLQKLCWTTSCFDKEFRGQRLHHLMKEGRRAYPLFRQDLVESTDWSEIKEGFRNLSHLEMDWLMSLSSWKQLRKAAPNLTRIKGVVQGDEQLLAIGELWPGLEFLELAHGSLLTAQGLGEHLPKLANLRKFTWAECACTRTLFQMEQNAEDQLRKVGMRLKDQLPPQAVITLPWNLADNTSSTQAEQVCIQAEFEQALLTGESTSFFQAITTKL